MFSQGMLPRREARHLESRGTSSNLLILHPSACISSIMRFVAGVRTLDTKDLTYTLVDLYLWRYVENLPLIWLLESCDKLK